VRPRRGPGGHVRERNIRERYSERDGTTRRSSVVRALARYERGTGFDPRSAQQCVFLPLSHLPTGGVDDKETNHANE
jgi:hypothetical protein